MEGGESLSGVKRNGERGQERGEIKPECGTKPVRAETVWHIRKALGKQNRS